MDYAFYKKSCHFIQKKSDSKTKSLLKFKFINKSHTAQAGLNPIFD